MSRNALGYGAFCYQQINDRKEFKAYYRNGLNVMKIVTVSADATVHVGIFKGMTGSVTSYDADTGMAEI